MMTVPRMMMVMYIVIGLDLMCGDSACDHSSFPDPMENGAAADAEKSDQPLITHFKYGHS